MLNIREKLIELLTDRIPGIDNELRYVDDERVERLADYLIANGVTVTSGIIFECKHVDKDGSPQTIRRMFKVHTNADRIRAMSDEVLAHWICKKMMSCSSNVCPGADLCQSGDGLANGLVKWLKQPVETENVDRCVCCGAIIPEGQIVCPNCLVTVKEG